MKAPPPHVPLDELRATAHRRVQATSLRQTAEEIELSPTGLQGFLDGNVPYAPTLRKLLAWHAREEVRLPIDLAPETVEAAFDLLLRHLPDAERAEATRYLLQPLGSEPGPAPEWLRKLLTGEEGGGASPDASTDEAPETPG